MVLKDGPRVALECQWLRQSLPVDGQLDRVGARPDHHAWPWALSTRCGWPAKIPQPSMHATRRSQRLGRRSPDGLHGERVGIARLRRIAAGIAPNDRAGRIGNLEDDRSRWRGLQIEIDDRAPRRILGLRLVLRQRRALLVR